MAAGEVSAAIQVCVEVMEVYHLRFSIHQTPLHLRRSYSRRNADFATHFHSLITSPLESPSAIAAATPIRVPDGYRFCGSLDGLICLSLIRGNSIRLWNPATRSMSQPSPPLQGKGYGYLGFGYDCSTETYKVVEVIRIAPPETTVTVYNNVGDTDTCWRSIQVSPLPRTNPRGMYIAGEGNAVYVSNTLNWLALIPEAVVQEQMKSEIYIIFSFDLVKENCGQLSLPYCPRRSSEMADFNPILGVMRGCLCFANTSNNSKKLHFAVWQMKEFGVHNSWTFLFNITTGYESMVEYLFVGSYFAMYMSENGDFLLSKHGLSKSVLYTQKDNKFEVTNIANNYIESLVSPY